MKGLVPAKASVPPEMTSPAVPAAKLIPLRKSGLPDKVAVPAVALAKVATSVGPFVESQGVRTGLAGTVQFVLDELQVLFPLRVHVYVPAVAVLAKPQERIKAATDAIERVFIAIAR